MRSRWELTPLVGRAEATEGLRTAAAVALMLPTMVLVSGEAGIGKSRLVEQFAQEVRDSGGRALVGGCIELAGEPIPYAPLAEILRNMHRDTDTFMLDDQSRSDLDHVLGVQEDSRQTGKPELYERVLRLLGGMAASAGVTPLIFEDLHWADQATLDLIVFLSRNLPPRVLFVLTYRDDELGVRSQLRPVLAVINRSRSTHLIELARLTRSDLAVLFEAIRGEAPTPTDIDQLFVRSEGNPFLAEELLIAGEPDAVPASLDDVLLSRAARLGQDAERVMRLVAIVGRPVSHDLLVASVQLSEDRTLAALAETVDCGLLVVDRQREEYAFRHVLTQEAVLNRLLPGERRRLHAAIATAIGEQPETAHSASRAAEWATHWYLSADTVEAFKAAANAGRLAAEVYAYAEAWRQYSRALALDERIGGQDDGQVAARIILLTEAAEVARWTGSLDTAVSLSRSALNLTDISDDQARITERIGRYLWESGHTEEAHAAFEQAHVLLADSDASPLTATIAASRAHFVLLSGHHEAAIPLARSAVELAKSMGEPAAQGRAQITLGLSLIFDGCLTEGAELVRIGQEMVSRWGDLDDRRRADSNLSYALLIAGKTSEACQAALDGLALIRRYGLEAAAGAGLTANAVVLLRLAGRWGEAQQLSDEVLSEEYVHGKAPQLYLARAELGLVSGHLDQTRSDLDLAWQLMQNQAPIPLIVDLWLAESQFSLEKRDFLAARHHINQALLVLSEDSSPRTVAQLCRLALRIEADIAERAQWTRSPDYPEHNDALSFLTRVQQVNLASPSPEGAAITLTAEAEYSRCQLKSAEALWEIAGDAWERLSRPYERAYCCFRQSEAAFAGGKGPSAGAESLLLSHELSSALGATTLQQEIGDLARRSRISLQSRPQPLEPLPTAAFDLGLTPRELDVLGAVVLGSSNRDIAVQLFLSPRTIAVHMSNILRKLGVSNRGQAAAAAIRLQLLQSTEKRNPQ